MPLPKTQEEIDLAIRLTKESLGDLVNLDSMKVTPEQAEHINVLTEILMGLPKLNLAAMAAVCVYRDFGKAAPAIARRMVEVVAKFENEDEE